MFRNNLGLKIFALVLAIIVWVQLSLLSEHQSVVNLKVELSNASAAPALAKQLTTVPFNVRGKGFDILKLKLSKTVAEFDARDISRAPNNISTLDYVLKNKPVNLDIEILGVVRDFAVGTGKPDQLALNQKGSAKAGLNSFPAEAAADAVKKASGRDQNTTRVLENISIISTSGMQLLPSTATLKVAGRQSSLDSLPRGLSVVAADNSDASGTFELSVRLPEGVELLDITPKRVRRRK